MDAIQERTEHLKEEAYKYSRDVHSKVDSLLKGRDAGEYGE